MNYWAKFSGLRIVPFAALALYDFGLTKLTLIFPIWANNGWMVWTIFAGVPLLVLIVGSLLVRRMTPRSDLSAIMLLTCIVVAAANPFVTICLALGSGCT